MKIIAFENPTQEGIVLEFDKPESMNGGVKSLKWFMSWDKLSELLTNKRS